ncbi:carbohydrate ABC transporter permease [Trueperella pyogenes]|uniref:carbohydrate ABC transporter permease n=1 Tax=Trueperella pyogenes TaxID=1661 RepID=UPI000D25891B|nr:sugar ABC transporter permease [Trueperella pyogenes]AWA44274.1 sugar ABC transporter permease [Trueperella pyogenes]
MATPETSKRPGKSRRRGGWRQWGPGLLLISPSLILVGVFVYGLIGSNIYTSFQDNHSAAQLAGNQPIRFVGFENFLVLFSNPDFQHSLKNLLIFTVAFLAGTLMIGFLWAWLMERPIRGEGFFRSVFLFPMAVSFIASGVVWRWLLNPGTDTSATGLNRLFQMIGLDFLQNKWTASESWAILAIALAAIWQLSGYVMALFLAGFRGISEDLREASKVDGANGWQTYRHIIFPQLTPVALSAVIIIAHMSLKSFDLIISITNQTWYPTKVPAIDMYNYMTVNDYSMAAAVGTILLAIVAVFVIPYLIHDSRENRR